MARLTVGDRVIVTAEGYGVISKHGTIREDDGSGHMPYKVDFDTLKGKGNLWFSIKQVQPEMGISSSPTPGKPVTSFEVGKWYLWVGPKDYRENWASQMEAWKDGKPRKCIGVSHNNTRGNFEGIGEYYYGHCLEHFREVPSPYQGHEHSVPSGVFATFQHQICSVDPKRRIVAIAAARPVSTRAAIRRRLLNLE